MADNAFETLREDRGWPTPNHMRTTADSLDGLTVARYGDILRWVADLCDGLEASPMVTVPVVVKMDDPEVLIQVERQAIRGVIGEVRRGMAAVGRQHIDTIVREIEKSQPDMWDGID